MPGRTAIRRRDGLTSEAAGTAREAPRGGDASMVRLEGVRKSFGDLLVLDGVDLEVSPGEVLVVIGPSGSGKSTLLRCVNLLEPVDSGRIFLEGEEITRQGRRRLRACGSASASSSSSSTCSRTCASIDNLTLARAPRPQAAARARPRRARASCSQRVGLEEKARQVPAPALGRAAAAGGDRPGAGDGPARHAVRRGHVGARPRARRRGADRDARPRQRRHDDDRRDARDELRPRGRATSSSSWTRA